MITKLSINNYKSINSLDIPLGRVNVFIGENGCGKSNILEAIAFLTSAKSGDLKPDGLFKRGIRVTKPSLTFNSFLKMRPKASIDIKLIKDDKQTIHSQLICNNPEDIYAEWEDKVISFSKKEFEESMKSDNLKDAIEKALKGEQNNKENSILWKSIVKNLTRGFRERNEDILNYLIYNISTNALRGITNESLVTPLGINGEGLDVLISSFNETQLQTLIKFATISWLESISVDKSELLKLGGYKLGRSISNLYFTDRFMQKKNNLFSAENANEGALHVLFYLALIISEKTPSFLAIDNVETCLNPKLCRDLIYNITILSREYNKQLLITTHNPAVLDGLNLHDPEQHLFVVKRNDEGRTKIEQIKVKKDYDTEKRKLSELWMRGYLGGLPSNSF